MGLTDTFILPVSGRYANPENQNENLPLLYGDNSENSLDQGVFQAIQIDTINHYFCFCQTPVLSVANGNIISVFDDGGVIDPSNYTVITDEDVESQGRIAYINFSVPPAGTVTVSCSGRAADGVLITNPIDIIDDMLALAGDTTPKNVNAFTQARFAANFFSYVAAGIILANQDPWFWIRNILSSFLGEAWINNRQELAVRLDTSLLSTIQIAGNIREKNCRGWSGTQNVKNLVNKIPINYAAAYTDIDKRFSESAQIAYFQTEDGESTQDDFSILRYGLQQPKSALEFDWCRHTGTVNKIQTRIIDKSASPTWFPINVQEVGFDNIHVEKGDFVTFSWEERKDEDGLPLRNQIAQVKTKDIDGDFETIRWALVDTGTFLSEAPDIWDGSVSTGDGGTFGGARDRRLL